MTEKLFLHHHIIVDGGQSPERIDVYISHKLENISVIKRFIEYKIENR